MRSIKKRKWILMIQHFKSCVNKVLKFWSNVLNLVKAQCILFFFTFFMWFIIIATTTHKISHMGTFQAFIVEEEPRCPFSSRHYSCRSGHLGRTVRPSVSQLDDFLAWKILCPWWGFEPKALRGKWFEVRDSDHLTMETLRQIS